MKITYNRLVGHRACEEQKLLFRKIFGNEVTITGETLRKYYEIFYFEWVVRNLFPKESYETYWQDCRAIENGYLEERKPLDDKCKQDYKYIRNGYWQDRKPVDDKYLYDKAMLFYKLSLTLP